MLGRPGEVKFLARVGPAQGRHKFSAKHPTENLHREKEAGVLRSNPALMIGRQSTGRHDTMHMRMADEGLAPGVEDAQYADLRAQMSRVGGHLTERSGARLKEP